MEPESYLEKIALDLVITKKNNKTPASLLEQEIEHILEQLRELREQRRKQKDYYGKYALSIYHQPMDSCLYRTYAREEQKGLYSVDIRDSGNQEARIQELMYKLEFLINKHEQSDSGHLRKYWAGCYS